MKRKIRRAARWTPGLKKLKAISIRQPWTWLVVTAQDAMNWFAACGYRFILYALKGFSRATDAE
jgi:hypothetical protein